MRFCGAGRLDREGHSLAFYALGYNVKPRPESVAEVVEMEPPGRPVC